MFRLRNWLNLFLLFIVIIFNQEVLSAYLKLYYNQNHIGWVLVESGDPVLALRLNVSNIIGTFNYNIYYNDIWLSNDFKTLSEYGIQVKEGDSIYTWYLR